MIFSLVLLLLASAMVAVSSAVPVSDSNKNNLLPTEAWYGSLTIYPNGTLSDPGAPVLRDGNHYDFTGNINGTFTVLYGGALVNGNGHTVWNSLGVVPVTLNNANNILLENIFVSSWYAPAINIISSSYDTIINNSINAMGTGIYDYSPHNNISGNSINMNLTDPFYAGTTTGILVKGSSTTLYSNEIMMPRVGNSIVVEGDLSVISFNAITYTGTSDAGISVTGSSNTIFSNNITGTGAESAGIKLLAGTQSSTVTGNSMNLAGNYTIGISVGDGFNLISENIIQINETFTNGIFVLSSGNGNNNVLNNTVRSMGQSSIGIQDTSQGTVVSGNSISVSGAFTWGMTGANIVDFTYNTIVVTGDYAYGMGASSGNIIGNHISASGTNVFGIYSVSGQYILISDNYVIATGSSAYGTQLEGSLKTFSDNTVMAGYNDGVAFFSTSITNSKILNNNLSNSSIGLKMVSASSQGITFVGNSMYNDQTVFRISGVSSNLFYHNSFVNYSVYQLSGNQTSLKWDNGYPSGGNFWSPYSGTDIFSGPSQNITGSDGIGDTPFNVSGRNIDNFPLMKPWQNPQAIFIESGLPEATVWSVNFSGDVTGSASSQIAFNITTAAYADYTFSIADIQGYTLSISSGTVSFNGSDVITYVNFTAIPPPPASTYNIVFRQNGLSSGETWSVTLNGTTISSSSSEIRFDPVNGTYSYAVNPIAGYSCDCQTGTVVINGQDQAITVSFTIVTYSVTFSDVGLPSGITWYINLSNGKSYSSTGSIISFEVPNGTYTYTVDSISGYNSTPESGKIVVSGNSPAQMQITFDKYETTPPPVVPSSSGLGVWAYIIGGVIGAAISGVVALVLYNFRHRW